MKMKKSSKLMEDEIILNQERFYNLDIVIFPVVFIVYLIFCYFYLFHLSDNLMGLFMFKSPFVLFLIFSILVHILRRSSEKVIVTNKRIILSFGYLLDVIRRNLTNKSFSVLYSEIDSISEEKIYNKSFLKTVKINPLNKDIKPFHMGLLRNAAEFLAIVQEQLNHYKDCPQLYKIDSQFVRTPKYPKKRSKRVTLIRFVASFSFFFVISYFIGYSIGHNYYKQIYYITNYSVPNYVKKYNPNEGSPYYHLSLYYNEINDTDKAIENAKKAVKFAPNNTKFLNFLGNLYVYKRDYDTGTTYLKKAIDLKPKFICYYYDLAHAYALNGRHDKSINVLTQALKLEPNSFGLYNNIANNYMEKKEYDTAIKYFNKSANLDKKQSLPYANLCDAYHEKGLNDIAIKYCKKALKLKGNDSLAYVYLADIYYSKGSIDSATDYYKKAIKLAPEHTIPYKGLAKIYYDKGLYDLSAANYKKAKEYDKYDAETNKYLEMIKHQKNIKIKVK